MADSTWAIKTEDTLFGLFKHEMNLQFKSTYASLVITQDEEASVTAKFPTILVRQVSFSEAGRDIEGNTINAIIPTYQITITFKGDRDKLVNLTASAVNFYKSKRFEVSNVVYQISNGIRTAIFRATRTIGSGYEIM